MTNIYKKPEKKERKQRLFQIGIETLQKEGWAVQKVNGLGKSSVRQITKNGESKRVSIRTSQDQWVAFPMDPKGKGWVTLDDVDVVLAVSVDDPESPGNALVHWLPADEMRKRFNQALEARKGAKRNMRQRGGIWIPLYEREDASANVSYVGGGAGLDHPAIATVPLSVGRTPPPSPPPHFASGNGADGNGLTIAQAKRGLSAHFGVPESGITITIEA